MRPSTPPPAPETNHQGRDETPGSSAEAEAEAALGNSNGMPAVATPAAETRAYVGLLGAPVPPDAAVAETTSPDDPPASSYSSMSRPAHAELGKTFDVATTRRRPVVFEEDDDLDVPDFLK